METYFGKKNLSCVRIIKLCVCTSISKKDLKVYERLFSAYTTLLKNYEATRIFVIYHFFY